MASTGNGILQQFARQFRRLASAFREKPEVALDDYLLEHYMLYHGLVGTSPEDQPKVRDVRADILESIKHRSPTEMAVALKLPPLWWEEKLARIFEEFRTEHGESTIACLLPEYDPNTVPDADPLRHPDWRVRANAARMLGHLGVQQAAPRMVAALEDESDEQQAAICHVAYGLAKLQSDEARQALIKQLENDEPWFRVDAAGALSQWSLHAVAYDLMEAMLRLQPMSDYMAVAIARRHRPLSLLQHNDATVREGALEVVIGLVEATGGPAAQDIPFECGLHECLPAVLQMATEMPTPRRVRAANVLAQWIRDHAGDIGYHHRSTDLNALDAEAAQGLRQFGAADQNEHIVEWLRVRHEDLNEGSNLRHACKLAGDFKSREAAPYLVALSSLRSPVLDEAIDSLACLEEQTTAAHLVKLVNDVVDINERTNKVLSKQPVFEDNPAAARTYWRALRALGKLPTAESAHLLLAATRDFAADKRQQALSSLISVSQDNTLRGQFGQPVAARIGEALDDPSPAVKAVALQGVGELKSIQHLPEVVRLIHARETAVSRQAQETARQLHAGGCAGEVETALGEAVSTERDQFRRQRLQALLQSLKP